jgi:hypothetical protein
MSYIKPKLADRFRAATSMLIRSGERATVCSFCGRDKNRVSCIVAGPGVAICWECAQISADFAYSSTLGPPPDGKGRLTITPVLEDAEKVATALRATLHEILTRCAESEQCALGTWAFSCRAAPAGDHLAFDVICDSAADQRALREKLLSACRVALGFPAKSSTQPPSP